MAPITIFSLPPEIFPSIGSNLDQRSLARCLLVCQEWTSLFTPSFWECVQMSRLLMNEYFKTPDSIAAFTRNRHLLRVLETKDPEFLLYLDRQQPPALNALQQLTFLPAFDQLPFIYNRTRLDGKPESDNMTGFTNVKALLSILDKATKLQQLTLGEGCFWNRDKDVFLPITTMFPAETLEKLHISFDRRAFPIGLIDTQIENKMAQAILDWGNQSPFIALKEISISGENGQISIPRMAFLARCGSLERVRLDSVDERFMRLVPTYLRQFCPRLTSLQLTRRLEHEDEAIALMLRSSVSGWKELRLPWLNEFGPLAFEALMESAATLEVLVIAHWGRLDKACFLDLLCSAERLRRLEGLPDGETNYNAAEVWVHAYDAFLEHIEGRKDRTWALGPSMEYLQMQIVGVPRPDVACRLNGGSFFRLAPFHLVADLHVDASQRYDVQRYIYEQLGRMTGLQELLLGILGPDWDHYEGMGVTPEMDEQELEEELLDYYITFRYRCLEFSLESGLELLSGLKELRVLDVRSTAHRIGVKELEWMSKNWPKLKAVKGLYACRNWTGDKEDNKVWEDAVKEWMGAHPDGIGCSYYLKRV
ncbi:hypothetical protein BGW39_007625 [Mortierella sp. 14UC]|nr:hypothetical protein BGW39_007625 [Mortierella sp. 14UC]